MALQHMQALFCNARKSCAVAKIKRLRYRHVKQRHRVGSARELLLVHAARRIDESQDGAVTSRSRIAPRRAVAVDVDMHDALARLDADVASGSFLPEPRDEDVHTALERGLIVKE